MTHPLQGRKVVVTRPAGQEQDLMLALEQAGAKPLAFPTLAIEPREPDVADRQKILDLDRYYAVICVSANAARFGLDMLADFWPQWPVQQLWFAVGPATGEAMSDWGLNINVAQQGSTSETLLDHPALQDVSGQRILVLRGEGGRETLADRLRERGAQVDYLELYRRVKPATHPRPLLALLDQPECPILTVTSGDGLRNLMAMAGNRLNRLQQCPLLVISGRLAEFARQQGFVTVWQAASPAATDVIAALNRALHPALH
ncbi:MAG: uroporphyrinogen-III synthase [Gammaproteobacteria bacterium]|nr:uroporphyrinogen-III synthase [Gammaproteobacteria bacterium]